MSQATIDQVLARISSHLHLSKETEYETLSEIRTHLEDAVAKAVQKGEDEGAALLKAAEQFGIDEFGAELQQVHTGREAIDAIALTALPVLFTLILRWLVFAPQGTAQNWQQLLTRPSFWNVAVAALVIPALWFRRWSLALTGWVFFWLLSVIFVLFPVVKHW